MADDKSVNIVSRLHQSVMKLKEAYLSAIEAQKIAEDEVVRLRAEIERLKGEIALSKSQMKDVEAEQQRLIAAQGFIAEEGDAKSARLRVNKLVREIEKCILLLNE